MIHDRFEFWGTTITVITTAVCTVIAVVYSVKLGIRAKARSDELRQAELQSRRGWFGPILALARPWIRPVLVYCAVALIIVSFVYQSVSLSKTTVSPWKEAPPQTELTQTPEWHAWRAKVHDKLSSEPITDKTVAEALQIKMPRLPEPHTEADQLRRDQAVAEVLLSYNDVRKILKSRFGIDKDFLGTGLSKPLGPTPYSMASVHEYLIDNHPDTHDHVWLWKITSLGKTFSQPVQSLLAGEDRILPNNHQKRGITFDDDLKEILLRVKNRDHPIPPMIRFARFDDKRFYKGTVGRPDAARVFTSNLSEVWDLTIQQAAEKSGYTYRGDGDTLFIWVFVPYQSNEFTPATWRHVLERLPEWLEQKNK